MEWTWNLKYKWLDFHDDSFFFRDFKMRQIQKKKKEKKKERKHL